MTVTPQLSELDLEGLLAQVGLGSNEAFADLYDRFGPAMHGISSAVFKNPGEAEAATEEAFLEIWRSAPRYRVNIDPEKWLFTMAVWSVGRRI